MTLRVELHVNGRLVVELTPETPIEKLVLAEMATGATQGKVVVLAPVGDAEDGAVQIGVGK